MFMGCNIMIKLNHNGYFNFHPYMEHILSLVKKQTLDSFQFESRNLEKSNLN
jgi:hypothetical protein